MDRELLHLEETIQYRFHDSDLLKQAMTHPSYSGEMRQKRYESNQRLEFLGDAVLELIISDYLYHAHPEVEEGELTRKRSSLVFEPALTVCAKDIRLGEYILLGKGEEICGGREKPSILSDTFEALIGAIYLDGGFAEAKRFIYDFLISDIDELSLLHDGKSRIQEYVQRTGGQTLSYRTESLESPDHMKRFHATLLINDRAVSEGYGHSKKNAEQDAAAAAIRKLRIGM